MTTVTDKLAEALQELVRLDGVMYPGPPPYQWALAWEKASQAIAAYEAEKAQAVPALGDAEFVGWRKFKEPITLQDGDYLVVPAQSQQEPMAWRDHVEDRLRSWHQRFVNKSGDQLALDDFMDKESLDDLLDYVLDEYTSPPPAAQPAQEERVPLTWEKIEDLWAGVSMDCDDGINIEELARAVERAHGILPKE